MNASNRADADDLRAIEVQRLRDLVTFDLEASRARHADDFQLINPAGQSWSRDAYLGRLQSGALIYHVWEPPTEIAVRMHGDVAILRYRAAPKVTDDGQLHTGPAWFTDLYERRDDTWQVVWSQATAILP
jgi:hypothetical protein